jgi:hypothetical protein
VRCGALSNDLHPLRPGTLSGFVASDKERLSDARDETRGPTGEHGPPCCPAPTGGAKDEQSLRWTTNFTSSPPASFEKPGGVGKITFVKEDKDSTYVTKRSENADSVFLTDKKLLLVVEDQTAERMQVEVIEEVGAPLATEGRNVQDGFGLSPSHGQQGARQDGRCHQHRQDVRQGQLRRRG